MKSLFTIISSFIISVGFTQNETSKTERYNADFEMAEKYFKTYSYKQAIKFYEKAFERDTTNQKIMLGLASSYYQMRDMEHSEYWANLLLAEDYQPSVNEMYFYIEILATNQHYDEATYWYNKYIVNDTTLDSTKINRMKNFLQDPDESTAGRNIQVAPINVNSDSRDFGATYYKNGVVFASGRRPSIDVKKVFKNDHIDYLRLYLTKEDSNGVFSDPKIFDKHINTQYHQGPVAFYDNFQKVIFTQSSLVKRRLFGKRAGRSEKGEVNLKLYIGDYEDGEVKNITPFEYNSDYFSTAHATVSKDGRKMIFSSNRPDAIGGSDLYICYRIGEKGWTPPQNLGPKINTTSSELFPYLLGNVLYFSSDGHKGYGGLDIYASVLVHDKPQEIRLLDYPINTTHDDFALVTRDGHSGFYATNRGKPTDDEMYSFKYVKIPPPLTVKVSAYDSSSYTYIQNPRIRIEDTVSTEYIVPMSNVGDSIYTYVINPKNNYEVVIQSPGYFIADSIIYSGDSLTGVLEWKMPLGTIKANVAIEIPNIYYDFDKASLRDSSRLKLNELISWLEENPKVKIEISAHTDSRGNDNYNMKLSQRRAESVVGYIVESGIIEDRLVAKGYGESKPIIDCSSKKCTREEYQLNRRTEMKVIEIAPPVEETPSIKTQKEETGIPPVKEPETE